MACQVVALLSQTLLSKLELELDLWTSILCQNCKYSYRQRNANPPISPLFPLAVTEDSFCNSRKHGLIWVKKDCFLVPHELLMWCTTLPVALHSQSACLSRMLNCSRSAVMRTWNGCFEHITISIKQLFSCVTGYVLLNYIFCTHFWMLTFIKIS